MNRSISMLNSVLLLICMQGWCFHLNAQVKRIGIEKGLSNNSITSIYQDRNRFMWFGTFDGLNRYDGYTFKTYKNSLTDTLSLPNNRISCIQEDGDGKLWIGTKSGSYSMGNDGEFSRFYYYSIADSKVKYLTHPVNYFLLNEKGTFFVGTAGDGLIVKKKGVHEGKQIPLVHGGKRLFQFHVQCMALDRDQGLWLYVQNTGLAKWDPKQESLDLVSADIPIANDMLFDRTDQLWLGTERGVMLLKKTGKGIAPVEGSDLSLPLFPVMGLRQDRESNIWIAFDGMGLFKYDPKVATTTHYYEQDTENQLSSDAVYAIYEDWDSRIWIGTLRGGVNVIDPHTRRFLTVREGTGNKQLSRNFILSFCEESPSKIWIGTDGAGLKLWDKEKNEYTSFKHEAGNSHSLSNNFVVSLVRDGDFLWAATYGGGLNRINLLTREIKRYACYNPVYGHFNQYAWGLYRDTFGHIWIGTLADGGIYRYNKTMDQFELMNNEVLNVLAFAQDQLGDLWVGSFNRLMKLTREGKKIKELVLGTSVRSIVSTGVDSVWVGTEGRGLILFDGDGNQLKSYSEADGLSENAVLNILEDNKGKFWLSTFKGLSEFDPKSGNFRNFYESDGLQSNQFNYNAALKLSTGELLFGGINGFNIFHPSDIGTLSAKNRLVINGIRINNTPVSQKFLREDDQGASRLQLTHDRAVLSVDFANLEYSFPDKIKYAFWLEGWEKDWNYVGTNRSANYGKLPSGKYVLHIKSTDADGQWNKEERLLYVDVSPPWWGTWWAYTLYALVVIALVQFYLSNRRRSMHLKYEVEKAKLEQQQEHELNEKKISFFTHVSHELRTPLTLIVSPLRDLLSKYKGTSDEKELKTIYRNSKRLLSMVDQLLLFKKMEDGKDVLKVQSVNVRKVLREVYECYHQLALQRKIAYTYDDTGMGEEEFVLAADKEKLEIILFNLLSNAFKYTPDGGRIMLKVSVAHDSLSVAVEDNGAGVPEAFRGYLFERFSRDDHNYKSGFGIGLYLVREYANLHGGAVRYESLGQGSGFVLDLPLSDRLILDAGSQELSAKSGLLEELLQDTGEFSEDVDAIALLKPLIAKKPILMLIDDDDEVRAYIKRIFDSDFHVCAYPSALGAIAALEGGVLPIVILSDVMMPDMDGIAFCQRLKCTREWFSIPLVLLTADVSEENKLRGISCGADDYIHKPFSRDLLMAKVGALIRKQTFMEEQAYDGILLKSRKEGISVEDSLFLDRCEEAILSTVNDGDFNVKALGAGLGMSHSTFYKKIKQLTGRSISDFVRFVRLRMAAQNLLESEINISQAAFSVGYNDIKHFREQFQKEFDMTPSEFVKKYRSTFHKKYHLNT